jgi:hypothetical protein
LLIPGQGISAESHQQDDQARGKPGEQYIGGKVLFQEISPLGERPFSERRGLSPPRGPPR